VIKLINKQVTKTAASGIDIRMGNIVCIKNKSSMYLPPQGRHYKFGKKTFFNFSVCHVQNVGLLEGMLLGALNGGYDRA